ncbi:acireductone dioxygenase [Pseudomonas sp. sia0905]|jgi:1,2-dihydroxy-3-keto-5-methylthiopentene dioxygenase|uniref:acireductone dioxygenase n=1 Tax=Pseudomonas sp. sia0905 TaxID=2854783 RepID=UPI001C48F362|nr:acireductone dioxygenase [Pseudomonas sp. sia0905]MBV7562519.1 acireductone dioxygenase [Pseudomonas sp. sia0905]
MSRLSVHHQSSPQIPNKVLGHAEDIASTLAAVGIEYRELPLQTRVQAGDAGEAILAALGEALEPLKRDGDLSQAEVISIDQRHWPREGDKPVQAPVEVLADGAQLYLFLAGQGLLSLHVDDYVYALVGERNALISVPAGTRHWFDLGEFPHCAAIRLSAANAVAARPSGDAIAASFPRLED